jgi:hypothetical protein
MPSNQQGGREVVAWNASQAEKRSCNKKEVPNLVALVQKVGMREEGPSVMRFVFTVPSPEENSLDFNCHLMARRFLQWSSCPR